MRQRFRFILILIAVFPWAGVSQDLQLDHDQVFKELQEALTSDDWELSYLYNTMVYSHAPDGKLVDITKYDWEKIEKLTRERKISLKESLARDEKWTLVPHIAEVVYKTSIPQPVTKTEPELQELLQALEKSKSKSEFGVPEWVTLKYTLFYPEGVNGINILFSHKQRPEYLITIVPDIEVMKYLTFVGTYITITKLYYDDKNRVHELAFLMVRRTRKANDLIIKIFEKLNIGLWANRPSDTRAVTTWYFMPIGAKDNVLPLPDIVLQRMKKGYENKLVWVESLEKKLKDLTKAYEASGKTDEKLKKEIEKTRKILNEQGYPKSKEYRQQYEELKARWEAGDFSDTFRESREE